MTAATVAPKSGKQMKAYYNTGTAASPTWVEVCDIGDLSISDLTMGLAELKRRCNNFTKNVATLIQSIAVEFRLHAGLNQTVYGALVTGFFAGTVREWAFMDDDITYEDAQGLRCPMITEQFPFDQPLEEVAGHDVRLAIGFLKESSTEIDPSWYTVPGA